MLQHPERLAWEPLPLNWSARVQKFHGVLQMTVAETVAFQKLIGVAQSNKFDIER